MAEEREDPVPTDDPRHAEQSDQNAEESHPDSGAGQPATLRPRRAGPRTEGGPAAPDPFR